MGNLLESNNVDKKLNLEHYYHVFDSAFQFIGILDTDGILLDCNKASLSIIKESKEEILGHYFWNTPWWNHNPELAFKLKDSIISASKGEMVRFDTTHYDYHGNKVYIDFSIKPIKDEHGKVEFLIPEGRNITDIKKNEEKIRNINVELEDKVKLRTQNLEDSIDKLEIAQEDLIESRKLSSLGELVAGVSHEINTPIGNGVTTTTYLSKIINDLDMAFKEGNLTKGEFQQTLAEIRLGNDAILTNLTWAANLVNSFKQLAVDQSSDLKRDFSLIEILNDLKTSMRNVIKYNNHRIILKVDDTIQLYGDPGAFTQIFQNLIQNSIHHGFEDLKNGVIYIKAKVIENTLIITYMDNGRGIPEASIDKIYNPFFTTGRAKGRTGLGMSIVHNQLMKLKGRISIVNNEDSGKKPCENPGVEFNIEIPLDSLINV